MRAQLAEQGDGVTHVASLLAGGSPADLFLFGDDLRMPAFDFLQEVRDVLERNASGQRGGRPLANESAHLDHQIWLHEFQPTEKEFGSARELFDVFAHGEGLGAGF
jgi:hypothetical protein